MSNESFFLDGKKIIKWIPSSQNSYISVGTIHILVLSKSLSRMNRSISSVEGSIAQLPDISYALGDKLVAKSIAVSLRLNYILEEFINSPNIIID